MKTLFALITITILSTASLLAFGQSIYQSNNLPVADKIEQLKSGLVEIYRNKPAKPFNRNDYLRIERALHYLQSSKKLVEYNWHKRAISEAEKGMNLVALYNQNNAES